MTPAHAACSTLCAIIKLRNPGNSCCFLSSLHETGIAIFTVRRHARLHEVTSYCLNKSEHAPAATQGGTRHVASTSQGELAGRVALVTGGVRRIGRAIALTL